jgi:hydrogenase maturation protein HypF
MIAKGINAPRTSSLGRLFDGVAAILGLRQEVAFEGQAAMELEMTAAHAADGTYDVAWEDGGVRKISLAPIIRGVVDDTAAGVDAALISARFHQTMVRLFSDLCEILRGETGLNRVALSGGVFQNEILLRGLSRALEQRRFEVYSHRRVPTNDGGICLGQAVAAAARLKK